MPTFRYYLLNADGETIAAGYLNEFTRRQSGDRRGYPTMSGPGS